MQAAIGVVISVRSKVEVMFTVQIWSGRRFGATVLLTGTSLTCIKPFINCTLIL